MTLKAAAPRGADSGGGDTPEAHRGEATREAGANPAIQAVLFDLDGVIRHFDPRHAAGIERDHALPPGSIEAFAFSSPIIEEVTTGRITRSAWVSAIGRHIGDTAAAVAWGEQPFTADRAVLELIDDLRSAGYRTAVLTNGTDGIPDEIGRAHV